MSTKSASKSEVVTDLTSTPELFIETMSRVATPVAVVTSSIEGTPHGTTVSAFLSLSAQPPMVLVSLDARSDLLKVVRERGAFGVNILAAGTGTLARNFARKGSDKFDGVEWVSDHELPRLPNASGWVACTVDEIVTGGDHLMLLGRVISADFTEEAQPMTYHRRSFGTHAVPDLIATPTKEDHA